MVSHSAPEVEKLLLATTNFFRRRFFPNAGNQMDKYEFAVRLFVSCDYISRWGHATQD